MRKIYFLFPQMNLNSGGHLAQLNLYKNTKRICPAEAITYEVREEGTRFLDSVLEQDKSKDNTIFFMHWGPHVLELSKRLSQKNIVYVSYSTGYGFQIPSNVPIIASSKHTQAYWGRYGPNSPIFYLPCEISEEFTNSHLPRDIDVLVQKRKSSRYLLEELVPVLRRHCSVKVLDSWVDNLASVFNRSKIYLYDSTEYWIQHGVSEGFGLPPLEAIACGCIVFSSVNDALSDYLNPGINCHKLRVYSKQYDIDRILKAVSEWEERPFEKDPAAEYRKDHVEKRLKVILAQINHFFDFAQNNEGSIEAIITPSIEGEVKFHKTRILQVKRGVGSSIRERLHKIYLKCLHLLKLYN